MRVDLNPSAWLALACLLLIACGEPEGGVTLASPDVATFRAQVLPVLARDCAFHACHGARERFFQVLGPGRPRLDPASTDLDPWTEAEYTFNYERARSMIDSADPKSSLLLLKPLSIGAGGDGHEGTDEYGRDVYTSPASEGYLILSNWVLGAATAPAAAGTGVLPVAGTGGIGTAGMTGVQP